MKQDINNRVRLENILPDIQSCISTLVCEIALYATRVHEISHYTNSVHVFINDVIANLYARWMS